MKRIVILAVGCGLLACASASFAFEEQKMKPSDPTSSAAGGGAAGAAGVTLADPGVAMPRAATGTKIRVPGLGVIGEIPKMDFGLELLYGASQPRQHEIDRNEGTGVMGRVTVPLKSR